MGKKFYNIGELRAADEGAKLVKTMRKKDFTVFQSSKVLVSLNYCGFISPWLPFS
jgi:hypothetical protein